MVLLIEKEERRGNHPGKARRSNLLPPTPQVDHLNKGGYHLVKKWLLRWGRRGGGAFGMEGEEAHPDEGEAGPGPRKNAVSMKMRHR